VANVDKPGDYEVFRVWDGVKENGLGDVSMPT